MFGKARSREISKNGGAHVGVALGAVLACVASARGGLLYRSSVVLDDDVICAGCVTKVTVTVEWEPICQDQTGAIVICDPPGAYPLAVCTPAISSFVADLQIVGGACFVSGQAACGEGECVATGTCLNGTVQCPPPEYDEHVYCQYCNEDNICGPSCQGFNISPGESKTFWIKGLAPGHSTLRVFGNRPCVVPPPGGINEISHWFEDEAEFTVLSVDLDTDSDNDGHLNDGYDHLNGILDDDVEEDFPGRVLWPNADNDDWPFGSLQIDMDQAGPVYIEDDLAKIHLAVWPEDFEGTATLTWPTSVWIWAEPDKTASSADSFFVENLPSMLWVEGLDEAVAAELTLSVDGCCSDTIKITVFKVSTLTWQSYEQGNRAPSACPEGYNTGSLCIYPEAVNFSETPETLALRRRILLQGTVEPAPGVAGLVSVYLKHWDPDDPSADYYPIDEEVTNAGPDNYGTGAGFAQAGGAPVSTVTVQADAGGAFEMDYFQVSLQPGDNYCVSATTTPEYHLTLALVQEDVDGFMPGGGLFPTGRGHSYISQMLTTRRTLWVERDSMGLPVMPDDGPFHGAGVNPEGGEVGDDDVDPGNLDYADTSLLAQEYAKAYVDIAIVPPEVDTTEDMPFIHNYQNTHIVSPARDTSSQLMHWIVQVLNAYEAHGADDFDPNSEIPVLGRTFANDNVNATCYTFHETIRDVAVNYNGCESQEPTCPDTQPPGTIEARTVLHETLHRFNMPHSHENQPLYDWEVGPLDPTMNVCCEEGNVLFPWHIYKIRTTAVP